MRPPAPRRPTSRSPAELREADRRLQEVLALAAALPTRHEPELRYPRLPPSRAA